MLQFVSIALVCTVLWMRTFFWIAMAAVGRLGEAWKNVAGQKLASDNMARAVAELARGSLQNAPRACRVRARD